MKSLGSAFNVFCVVTIGKTIHFCKSVLIGLVETTIYITSQTVSRKNTPLVYHQRTGSLQREIVWGISPRANGIIMSLVPFVAPNSAREKKWFLGPWSLWIPSNSSPKPEVLNKIPTGMSMVLSN